MGREIKQIELLGLSLHLRCSFFLQWEKTSREMTRWRKASHSKENFLLFGRPASTFCGAPLELWVDLLLAIELTKEYCHPQTSFDKLVVMLTSQASFHPFGLHLSALSMSGNVTSRSRTVREKCEGSVAGLIALGFNGATILPTTRAQYRRRARSSCSCIVWSQRRLQGKCRGRLQKVKRSPASTAHISPATDGRWQVDGIPPAIASQPWWRS